MTDSLKIAGHRIRPGERKSVEIPVGHRYTKSAVSIPVEVIRGRKDGPRLFVCAAIHGDEINGVEIIRRLLQRKELQRLRGTLIAIPIVNVYGFVGNSRYLPDRRDLNRCFPGSSQGSLASRIAHRFMEEVVGNATHGIDLHTAAIHRENLPHLRTSLDNPDNRAMANAFGTPLILDATNLREGSLREQVYEMGMPMLVYEAGQALRFQEPAVRAGLRGILDVMRELGMIARSARPKKAAPTEPFVARSTKWVRAPSAGIFSTVIRLGAKVGLGTVLGTLSDPLGEETQVVKSSVDGVVIGMNLLPLVNEGDALVHIATFEKPDRVAESVESFREELLGRLEF